MDKQKVLAKLIWDLQSFLSVLDSENLSYIAQAQKKSISELLSTLQNQDAPVEDAEYMIMSCPSSSPSNELTDTPAKAVRASELVSNQDLSAWLRNGLQGPKVPPHPPGGLGGDDDDEDTYEEAEPYVPADATASNTEKAESDSSHYESYDEEDDDDGGEELVKDRAHYIRWSASQPCLKPTPESRLCGYLWRRKWLGQWSKELFIIRNDVLLVRNETNARAHTAAVPLMATMCRSIFEAPQLFVRSGVFDLFVPVCLLLCLRQCYKCARDLLPQLELNLRGCQLVYKSKSSRKIQHQLKLVLLGSETLVLGYSTFQQADEWKKVIEEVSIAGETEMHSYSSLNKSDQLLSCRSSIVQSDSDEEEASARCSLSKNKGFLNVLMNCQWQSLLCRVEAGVLNMFGEEAVQGERSPQYTVQLRGCEVKPDTKHCYRITLSMLDDQMAVLEVSWWNREFEFIHFNLLLNNVSSFLPSFLQVSSSEEKQRWLKLLQDGAAYYCHHDNKTQEHSGVTLSGLQTRRFPSSNTYMDDPFHLSEPGRDQPIYSNTSVLEHMLHGSQGSIRCSSVSSKGSVTYSNTVLSGHNRKSAEVQRSIQKLELTDRKVVPLRAGSEINLASSTKQNKRTSFRQSLAIYSERAQAGILNPLLRRTASAKNSLRRAPSALFIEHGKVFQRRKEWETKAAA
ncbi:actin filament-associated protein 1-like 2 isoform X2 [Haplochromis burtoni]|uniref:actin filament-associated protein 1-like 2 isoform X2 n=1 Tax=Haplochromis burtoni TaxID=8153 RepID=UPI001C2D9E39|nr:actin filament-associated protein 1-like 2 isoform X2 [Haplochromis burtoni]